MARPPKIPRDAIVLRTYAEFESYLTAFAEGKEPFLWISGRWGLSKSRSIERAVHGKKVYHVTAGALSPIMMYVGLFHHLGQPVIIDDAEPLFKSDDGARLLRGLTETRSPKPVGWSKASKVLTDEGVPRRFYTTSRVCVIANTNTIDPAILSRATVLYFDPSNLDVHTQVAEWFWDQEIHNWFADNLHKMRPVDMRWYVKASQAKENRRDWRAIVSIRCMARDTTAVFLDVEAELKGRPVEEKAAEWCKRTQKNRKTYFNIKKRLRSSGNITDTGLATPVPIIKVRGKKPADMSLEELQALNEREFGIGAEGNDDQDDDFVSSAPPPPKKAPKPDLPAPKMTKEEFSQGGTQMMPPPKHRPKSGGQPPLNSDDKLPWE